MKLIVVLTCLKWRPPKKKLLYSVSGIYLLEMTATENDDFSLKQYMLGIDLLEMTTIENYHIILISDDC